MYEVFKNDISKKSAQTSAVSSTSIVFQHLESGDVFPWIEAEESSLSRRSLSAEGFFWIPALNSEKVLHNASNLQAVPTTTFTSAAIAARSLAVVVPSGKALGVPIGARNTSKFFVDRFSIERDLGKESLRTQVSNSSAGFGQDFSFNPPARTGALPEAIVANWWAIYRSSFSESTYLRLLHLAGLSEGWNGPDSRSLMPISLGRFLSFWQRVLAQAKEPELVLTVSGTLQAEWHKNSTHFLEIDFSADKRETCYFALSDGPRATIEGRAKLDDLVELCSAHRDGVALGWQADAS